MLLGPQLPAHQSLQQQPPLQRRPRDLGRGKAKRALQARMPPRGGPRSQGVTGTARRLPSPVCWVRFHVMHASLHVRPDRLLQARKPILFNMQGMP